MLYQKIHDYFCTGDLHTACEIRTKLQAIFTHCNIEHKPTYRDITTWFLIDRVKIGTDNYYRLLQEVL